MNHDPTAINPKHPSHFGIGSFLTDLNPKEPG